MFITSSADASQRHTVLPSCWLTSSARSAASHGHFSQFKSERQQTDVWPQPCVVCISAADCCHGPSKTSSGACLHSFISAADCCLGPLESATGACLHSSIFGLQYQGGGKWGRRRPRWLMVERTYLHSLWRASQAAHKSQATSDHPSTPLDRIPPMHKVSTHCTMLLFTDCSSA